MAAFLEFVKSLVGLLNIPAIIADNIVSFFEKLGVDIPIGAKPWFALFISLFVCIVPLTYDRIRGSISKLFFFYGALYSILCALVIFMNFHGQQSTTYALRGSVIAISNEASSHQYSQHFETTVGCADRTSPIRRVCAPNFEIQSHTINITSANCGSRIVSEAPDPNDKKCMMVQENVQGCGEDNILGIKNCRGRGWLNYDVLMNGSIPSTREILHQEFQGALTGSVPFGHVFELQQPLDNVTWRYRVIVSQGDNQLALLTEQNSSSDLFRSTMSGGYLRVDLVRPANRPSNP
jgi:hypothetical protein